MVCFIIGDSAPYGIYVPVDEWLGRLAIAAGFKEFHFEKPEIETLSGRIENTGYL